MGQNCFHCGLSNMDIEYVNYSVDAIIMLTHLKILYWAQIHLYYQKKKKKEKSFILDCKNLAHLWERKSNLTENVWLAKSREGREFDKGRVKIHEIFSLDNHSDGVIYLSSHSKLSFSFLFGISTYKLYVRNLSQWRRKRGQENTGDKVLSEWNYRYA